MNFTAIDFETANSKRQSVCSVGLAVVRNGEIVDTVHRLIKPTPNYYEGINISIHGITQSMTEGEPTFAHLWDELRAYIEGQPVVAHNASFDFSCLRYAMDAYGMAYPRVEYFCTMVMGKKLYPELFNHKLPTMCEHFGVQGLDHHDAESDAVACARLMISMGKQFGAGSLEELIASGGFTAGKLHSGGYVPFRAKKR
ncbi:MAG: 3'-5' exonuclease [Cytophagales bacterium]|nr:3'-5' exonuclease [Cytophagales bacterium]